MGAGSTSLFLRYQRATGQWKQTGAITSPRGAIQPAVVEIAPGRLIAYNRRGGGYGPTTDGWLVRAESSDGGWTWTAGRDSPFPNPNAAVDFLKLQSGNLLLVYNDTMVGRTPLVAALSTDGDRDVPASPRTSPKARATSAYPIAVQTADGRIHVVYTSDGRRVINHAVFGEDWLLGGRNVSAFHGHAAPAFATSRRAGAISADIGLHGLSARNSFAKSLEPQHTRRPGYSGTRATRGEAAAVRRERGVKMRAL